MVGNYVLDAIRRIITGIRVVECRRHARKLFSRLWPVAYVFLYGIWFVCVWNAGLTLSTAAGLLAHSSSEASKSLVLSTRTIGRKVSRQLIGACCGAFSFPAAGNVIGLVRNFNWTALLPEPSVETGFVLVGRPYGALY